MKQTILQRNLQHPPLQRWCVVYFSIADNNNNDDDEERKEEEQVVNNSS